MRNEVVLQNCAVNIACRNNCRSRSGGSSGFANNAPYDVIVFTGSLQLRPIEAEKMLNIGGRLFAVVGEMPIMQANLTQRISQQSFRQDTLFETCLPPLENAPQAAKFEF